MYPPFRKQGVLRGAQPLLENLSSLSLGRGQGEGKKTYNNLKIPLRG
jgi:hypothetical protein